MQSCLGVLIEGGSGKKGGKKKVFWGVLTLRVGNHVARRVAQRPSLAAQMGMEAEGTNPQCGSAAVETAGLDGCVRAASTGHLRGSQGPWNLRPTK